jgi:hypothetical protein
VNGTREVNGVDGFGWGTSGKGVRVMKADGEVEIRKEDALWEEGVRVWKTLRDVGEKAKL